MATLVNDIVQMQHVTDGIRATGGTIGVVPTMGYLHEGHLTLIRAARQFAGTVITTLFVNPTQFGPSEDFERYPRSFERDFTLASEAGSDYLFAPNAEAMYPAGYATFVNVTKLDELLEGKSRPGHFRGVATVVAKLFNITHPHVAVFGQKDAQQVVIIKKLVQDLNFNTRIVVVPIVREPDGLAMSSRNVYLTPVQRKEAVVLYRALQLAEGRIRGGEQNASAIIGEMSRHITANSSGVVDYISIADNDTLEETEKLDGHPEFLVSLAVRFGSTRLIDNTVVTRK